MHDGESLAMRPDHAVAGPEVEDPATLAAPDEAERLLRLGLLLQTRMEFAGAATALHAAVALGCADPVAQVALGELARIGGAFLAEARAFDTAAALSGGHDEWVFLAGVAYGNAGLPDLAMQRFARLPNVLPDWWEGERARAATALARARATCRRLVPLLRTHGLMQGDARALLRAWTALGRLRAAQRLADWAVERFGDSPSILLARMRLEFRRGDVGAALRLLEQAPFTYPETETIVEFAAKLAMETADPDRASAYLDRWPRANWPHGSWIQAGRLRMVAEDAEGLMALARDWIARWPGHDSMPYRFFLEGLRFSCRLPFLLSGNDLSPPDGLGLMQFWDGPTPPRDVQAAMASWQTVNPGMPYTLLNLDSARAFIARTHGEDALATFEHCHHPAMQADYLRLLWLHTHGGLYVDVDEHCVAPVAPLFAALHDSEVVVVLEVDAPGYLNNCLIGARPGSPLLATAIAEVTRRTLDARAQAARLSIWNDTGPGLLTRSVMQAMMRAGTAAQRRAVATVAPRLKDFARNDPALAYKRTVRGNWRLA